jgi:hypothetical protein
MDKESLKKLYAIEALEYIKDYSKKLQKAIKAGNKSDILDYSDYIDRYYDILNENLK